MLCMCTTAVAAEKASPRLSPREQRQLAHRERQQQEMARRLERRALQVLLAQLTPAITANVLIYCNLVARGS
jgi:hypothetical protein